ncbi:PAS domain S-box protein [Arthrospiribacter ruber]|uniref:histidine kinase n=1 Tax=Arthrospiribacter ruber TaxID=2487934 RepID=A0A951MEJ2_9BACT|nr:PAS domain S-box protein [Arthrospiribacter ruber]MBW3467946.1 PAS domain S-box protein [Arthrospiribacter ruber]
MKASSNPNIQKRLQKLKSLNILDTLPEEEYDAITSLAAFICKTPISLITLLDENEQFFKSRYGLEIDRTPIEDSVCVCVLDDPAKPLVVPNLQEDVRFSDMPLIKGEDGLKFYAGMPLVMNDGVTLGALCVIDTIPRELEREQLEALKKLQLQVVKLLELRLKEQEKQVLIEELRVEKELKDKLIENTAGIFWEADANTFEFSYVSRQVKNILGYTVKEWLSSNTFWVDHIHPDDRNFAKDFCHSKTQKLEDHTFEYRMRTKSGGYIWVVDKVKVFEKEGKPHRLSGLIMDISKEKELEFRLEEELNFVRSILDGLPVPFYLLDADGRHLMWNKVLLDITGYSDSEMGNVKPRELYSPLEFEKIKKAIEGVYKNGVGEVKANITSKDGKEHPFFFKASKIFYRGQHCIFGIGMDMSGILEAEHTLKLKERKYRALVEEGSDLLFLLDLDARIFEVGPNIPSKLGYKPEELKRKIGFDFFHPDDKEKIMMEFALLQTQKIVQSSPYRFRHKSGHYLWYQSTLTNLMDDEAVGAVVVNSTDITSVMESERRFKALVQDGGDLISILDENGCYIYVSPTSETVLGVSPDLLIGKRAFDFVHLEDLARVKADLEKVLFEKRVEIAPFRFADKQGEWRWLETVATNMTEDPAIGGIVTNSRDITEKYLAQTKLAQSEARYRVFFESQTNYVLRTDLNGKYTYVNKKFLEEYGWIHGHEPIGKYCLKSICDYHHERLFGVVADCIRNPGKVFKVDLDKPAKDGSINSTLWDFVCLGDEAGEPSEIQCSGIDITERILTERELKRVNEMFELLNEASSESLYEFLPDEKELYLGKSFERIFHHKRKGLKENLDFIHALRYPADDLKMREKFFSIVYDSNETALNVKYRMLNGKGEYRWVEDSAVILRDKCGTAKRVIGTVKDVTEFQKMSILLDVATEVSKLGGWELNTLDNTLSWTPIACDIHKVPHDFQPDLKTALKFYRQDFRDLAKSNVQNALEKGISFDFEAIIVTADGEERWVRAIGDPEVIDGKSVRIYGSIQDIHDRKTAEEKVKASNERFEIITRATNDAIWDYDASTDELFWGVGFLNLFGYDPEELNVDFQFFISKIYPEDRKRVTEKMFRYMSGKIKDEVWNEEYRFIRSDGSVAYVTDHAVFIRGKDGVAKRALGAMSDVTERKEYENSLKMLNQKLEKSVQELAFSNIELEQFAYVASHDLQEPLRMISSFLGLLERKYDGLLDEKGKQYIHFATDGAARMKNIILDLLEFSRVGRHEDIKQEINIGDIVCDVLELNRRRVQEKNAQIKVGNMPKVKSFKTPLMQIFQNVIGNAFKYSKEDVDLEIEIKSKELSDCWEFSVSDNGIGISHEFHQKIFNLFQRLHAKNEYSGTGIGLAIVKKNVELLGGKISVESEEGVGSTFSFSIEK